jgi:hypothetical protein
VRIRELQARDEDALRDFFDQIPADDRTFFKEDLEEPEVLLHDQLRGAEGETQDVVVLSHFADEAAQDIALAMPEEAAS